MWKGLKYWKNQAKESEKYQKAWEEAFDQFKGWRSYGTDYKIVADTMVRIGKKNNISEKGPNQEKCPNCGDMVEVKEDPNGGGGFYACPRCEPVPSDPKEDTEEEFVCFLSHHETEKGFHREIQATSFSDAAKEFGEGVFDNAYSWDLPLSEDMSIVVVNKLGFREEYQVERECNGEGKFLASYLLK